MLVRMRIAPLPSLTGVWREKIPSDADEENTFSLL
jgi:hypothetical protein